MLSYPINDLFNINQNNILLAFGSCGELVIKAAFGKQIVVKIGSFLLWQQLGGCIEILTVRKGSALKLAFAHKVFIGILRNCKQIYFCFLYFRAVLAADCSLAPPSSHSLVSERELVDLLLFSDILTAYIFKGQGRKFVKVWLDRIFKYSVHIAALKLGVICKNEGIPEPEEIIGYTVEPSIRVGSLFRAFAYRKFTLDDFQLNKIFEVYARF